MQLTLATILAGSLALLSNVAAVPLACPAYCPSSLSQSSSGLLRRSASVLDSSAWNSICPEWCMAQVADSKPQEHSSYSWFSLSALNHKPIKLEGSAKFWEEHVRDRGDWRDGDSGGLRDL